jgi:hypothetical protein
VGDGARVFGGAAGSPAGWGAPRGGRESWSVWGAVLTGILLDAHELINAHMAPM